MADNTAIAWADATWSPLRGCSRVAEGCRNCYAERMAARGLPGLNSPTTGEPFAVMTPSGPRWTGRVELIESQLDVPLHWKRPRRIFVNSMSDTFHENVPDEWIDRVFDVMARSRQHTFMLLTKRGERMLECLRGFAPMPHIWLGVSASTQADLDAQVPHLLATPAAVRFVSLEPLIERVTFRWAKWDDWTPNLRRKEQLPDVYRDGKLRAGSINHLDGLRMLDWIISGGESGPGARPCQLDWIREILGECREAKVAAFVKQLGTVWARDGWDMDHDNGERWGSGDNPAQWPTDLNVQEFPR